MGALIESLFNAMKQSKQKTSEKSGLVSKERQRNFPVFSVVVAVLNGEKTIQKCIDSISSQTYPYKELIIIDGNSTDSTVNKIKFNSDKIEYWESQPDKGIYNAWNKALDHVSGDWVGFIGADDYFAHDGALAYMAAAIESNDYDVICSRGALIDSRGRVRYEYGKSFSWENLKKGHAICHPGSFYNVRLFKKFGKFKESYVILGDYDFNLRHVKTSKAIFLDRVITCVGDSGISKRKQHIRANTERILLQARHPEFGTFKAIIINLNPLCQALIKTFLYKIFPEHHINRMVDFYRKFKES